VERSSARQQRITTTVIRERVRVCGRRAREWQTLLGVALSQMWALGVPLTTVLLQRVDRVAPSSHHQARVPRSRRGPPTMSSTGDGDGAHAGGRATHLLSAYRRGGGVARGATELLEDASTRAEVLGAGSSGMAGAGGAVERPMRAGAMRSSSLTPALWSGRETGGGSLLRAKAKQEDVEAGATSQPARWSRMGHTLVTTSVLVSYLTPLTLLPTLGIAPPSWCCHRKTPLRYTATATTPRTSPLLMREQ
jgi:hypothetical protein